MLNLVNQNKQHPRKHTAIQKKRLHEEATFLLYIQRLHDIT